MLSTLLTTALGSLQASFSVLLTLSYGVLAAHLGMVNSTTAKDVSALCTNMFLPALLITNIGKQISFDNFMVYLPIFVWAVAYGVVCVVVGMIGTKVFKLPSWVVVAVAFNNTTSLPLLLTKSLTNTDILQSIAGGDVSAAVERAQSYFLINSMVSNAITFAIGPKLLKVHEKTDGPEEDIDTNESDGEPVDDESISPTEQTSLLPKPITNHISRTKSAASTQFHRLPSWLQNILSYASSLFNPILFGAILAITIGITPPLHKAFFAKSDKGGIFNAWLTSSFTNIGELFTSLQMYDARLSPSITLLITL